MIQPQATGGPQRTVEQPCSHCGHETEVPNGEYYRDMRRLAGLTPADMAGPCGIGLSQISRIERGIEPFQAKYIAVYERVCGRKRRSGEE